MSFSEKYPELIELLTSISQFGFTNLQAKAYISLISLGESTGSAIAEDSGINRSKVYDTLKDLEEMGAVRRVSRDKKTRYIGIPPEQVFSSIIGNFTSRINEGTDMLKELSEYIQAVDETKVTYSSMEMRELDVNEYKYLIVSNQMSLAKLINGLSPRNQPKNDIVILHLQIEEGPIILLSDEKMVIFQVPIGKIIENLISFESPKIARIFVNLLMSSWKLPSPTILEQLDRSGTRLLYTGVAIWVDQPMENSVHYEYMRPVFFIVSDTHVIFYYEGEEDHKVPAISISKVDLIEWDSVECQLTSAKSGVYLGRLRIKTIGSALTLKGVLEVISPRIT